MLNAREDDPKPYANRCTNLHEAIALNNQAYVGDLLNKVFRFYDTCEGRSYWGDVVGKAHKLRDEWIAKEIEQACEQASDILKVGTPAYRLYIKEPKVFERYMMLTYDHLSGYNKLNHWKFILDNNHYPTSLWYNFNLQYTTEGHSFWNSLNLKYSQPEKTL